MDTKKGSVAARFLHAIWESGCHTKRRMAASACPGAVAWNPNLQRNYFFMPTWANLLRNFSTRPPRLSMLFCVPV